MKVLVCVDGSDYSDNAVKFLGQRPWNDTDSIEIVTIAELIPVEFGLGHLPEDGMKFDKALKEECEKIANSALKHLKEKIPHVQLTTAVLEGYVTQTILDRAIEENVDLIVIGSHGRKGFQKLMLGSVAEEVLKNAPCSVEVVRPKLSLNSDSELDMLESSIGRQ